MQWRGWRIPVVLLAFGAGFLLLGALQWAFNHFSYREPLERALRAHGAVESFTLQRQKGTFLVTVGLKKVEDFPSTYRELRDSLQEVLGRRPFVLEIRDKRDGELQKAYNRAHLALYEAQVRGNYREAARCVEEEAARVGARAALFLDEENMYLCMERGDHYLYAVVPRDRQRP
ncbi:hypothetical protein [Desulfovirgula thermocuniculi]|uniref:hypothetical protein n=1 Tax=Desulfovirgula thermocuniculi TaxID=348842 RepID=UPI000404A33C|nr:hypothetical protein [Desulfovirgula thermocuniculi]